MEYCFIFLKDLTLLLYLQKYCNYFSVMKEEKKSKEMREKLKEKLSKKGAEKQQALIQQKTQNIEGYSIYIGEVIGEGSYGKVYKAKNKKGELVACKIISKAKLENLKLYSEEYAKQLQKRFKTQSEFHKQLSECPNIVKLIETIENSKAYYFFMEFCQTDLSRVIRQNGILSEDAALRYFRDMLEGYRSIYQKNAFHRDLKPQNLLLKDDVVKISDFGFVKIFNEIDQQCKSGKNKLRTQSKVGSIRYMAPDILNLALIQNECDLKAYSAEKSDIWSMGIILYKMLYGKEPFNGKDEEQMMKKINQKQLQFPDTVDLGREIIRNTKVSPEIKRLLKKMIDKDESSRMTFKKLYHTIRSYMKERGGQQAGSGIKQQGDSKQKRELQTKNKKQMLLIVYNKFLVEIYHDAVNYATLREISVSKYYELTCKLMTLIHEKRTAYLQTQDKQDKMDVEQKIKQQISTYHNSFWNPIKNIANLEKQDTIDKLLLDVHDKIKQYSQFDLLMKEVQIFLIDLLLLLSLQLKIVKPQYVYTWSVRSSNFKQSSILNYKQNTLTILDRKLNNKQIDIIQEQQEDGDVHHKKKDKTRQKQKKHKSKGKSKQKGEKDQQKQKEHRSKDKKDKSQEKVKDRSSRQKKSKK